MAAHLPPVPPGQQTNKGPASKGGAAEAGVAKSEADRTRNLAEQGREGNLKQNTTNKGFQQDR